MKDLHKNRSAVYGYLVVIFIFLYTLIRSYVIPISHDESVTFFYYVIHPFLNIFLYTNPIMSTNHLLNTILMKLSWNVFGISELSLRVPALLGHVLYLTGMLKILRLVLTKRSHFYAVCILVLNPFMLDYFSMARGYALGLGFLSWGIYFFLLNLKQGGDSLNVRWPALATWMLTLSTMAHLAFLQAYVALIFLCFIIVIMQSIQLSRENQPWKRSVQHFIDGFLCPVLPSMVFLLGIYIVPTLKMLRKNEFIGGEDGFWQDTVSSLITQSLYGENHQNPILVFSIKLIIITTVLLALIYLFWLLLNKKRFRQDQRYLCGMLALLAASSFVVILQWDLFKTQYVMGRRALYFIPLFAVFIVTLWQVISSEKWKWRRRLFDIFIYVIVASALFHFVRCANFRYFLQHRYDASTRAMIQHLILLNKDNDLPEHAISIGAHWPFQPAINYYIRKYDLRWLKWNKRTDTTDPHDYYYLFDDPGEKVKVYINVADLNHFERYKLKVIKKYELSESFLAVPTVKFKKKNKDHFRMFRRLNFVN